MSTLSYSYSLTPGTPEDVSQVMQNFNDVKTVVNGALDDVNIGVLPSCAVYNDAAQSIPDSTLTALTFNTEHHDTDAIHSTSSNTSRLTCVTTGIYVITASASILKPGNDTQHILRIRYNGSAIMAMDAYPFAAAWTSSSYMSCSAIRPLTAGDYVESVVYQNAGSAKNTDVTTMFPQFAMTWVGHVS